MEAEPENRPHVDDGRIVGRYIDDLRIRGHDDDAAAVLEDGVLAGGDQVTLFARHFTEPLHGLHHVARL